MQKSLSIVIPAYNEQRQLVACLDAIAAQTVRPDEVIVVDNNSTDKTAEVARRYPFVTVLEEKQQGIVYARNRGFDAARSDIIGRIDADTILSPDWVARVQKFYEDEKHIQRHAYTGGARFYNIRLQRYSTWIQSQIAFRANRFILGHYILYGSNMALPRALWQAVRGDVCLRNDIHEDLDLSIHLARRGYKITYHAGLVVGVEMRRVRSNRAALKANLMLWPQTLRVHGNRRWWLGWLGAELLYYGFPVPILFEWVARKSGKQPLAD